MKSKNLITCFGKESDIYIPDAKLIKMIVMKEDGKKQLKRELPVNGKGSGRDGNAGQSQHGNLVPIFL